MQIDAVSSAYPVTAGDINIYHARLIADQQITYVLEFSGTLEPDRLNSAFGVLVRELPILSSVVQVEGTHFRRKRTLDYGPLVMMAGEIESTAQVIERFTGTPCDPEREPPLKLLLIRAQGQDTLCFKAGHVLTDAAGLKVLLYGFADAYATGKITSPINPDRGVGQVFRKFSPIALLRAATKANLPRPGPTPIAGPFDAGPTFIEHVRLEPGEFERVHAAAKRWGATLNDILLAAVYRVVWQRLEQNQEILYPVMVPVDMRRYLPANQQGIVANLSSAVYPRLAAIPQESFSDTLARVTTCMDAFKRADPGLAAMLLMAVGAMQGGRMMLDRYRLAATRGSRFINLTNFGVIDGARCDFQVPLIQAHGVGPIQYAPGILLAMSTYRNTLHFTVQGNDTRRFQPFINSFLKSILEELEQAK
jgi:NRPS condensation-like uncharacterized protein